MFRKFTGRLRGLFGERVTTKESLKKAPDVIGDSSMKVPQAAREHCEKQLPQGQAGNSRVSEEMKVIPPKHGTEIRKGIPRNDPVLPSIESGLDKNATSGTEALSQTTYNATMSDSRATGINSSENFTAIKAASHGLPESDSSEITDQEVKFPEQTESNANTAEQNTSSFQSTIDCDKIETEEFSETTYLEAKLAGLALTTDGHFEIKAELPKSFITMSKTCVLLLKESSDIIAMMEEYLAEIKKEYTEAKAVQRKIKSAAKTDAIGFMKKHPELADMFWNFETDLNGVDMFSAFVTFRCDTILSVVDQEDVHNLMKVLNQEEQIKTTKESIVKLKNIKKKLVTLNKNTASLKSSQQEIVDSVLVSFMDSKERDQKEVQGKTVKTPKAKEEKAASENINVSEPFMEVYETVDSDLTSSMNSIEKPQKGLKGSKGKTVKTPKAKEEKAASENINVSEPFMDVNETLDSDLTSSMNSDLTSSMNSIEKQQKGLKGSNGKTMKTPKAKEEKAVLENINVSEVERLMEVSETMDSGFTNSMNTIEKEQNEVKGRKGKAPKVKNEKTVSENDNVTIARETSMEVSETPAEVTSDIKQATVYIPYQNPVSTVYDSSSYKREMITILTKDCDEI